LSFATIIIFLIAKGIFDLFHDPWRRQEQWRHEYGEALPNQGMSDAVSDNNRSRRCRAQPCVPAPVQQIILKHVRGKKIPPAPFEFCIQNFELLLHHHPGL
jgi:hypothetical protein